MSPGLSRRRVCGTRASAVSPVHEAVRQQDLSSLLAVATALRAHCSPTAPGPLQLCLEPHACPQLPPSRPRGLTPAVPAGRRAPLQRRFAAIRHTVRTTARGLELGGRSWHLLRLRANGELGAGTRAGPHRRAGLRLGWGVGWGVGGVGHPAGLSRHLVAGQRPRSASLAPVSSESRRRPPSA